jgi:DNA-binding MarR family transcriptional regulator
MVKNKGKVEAEKCDPRHLNSVRIEYSKEKFAGAILFMNAQKESFEFDLNTFYRLERTKRPSTSIALYAELLASMAIQNSTTINCEVRFLSKTLKMGTHTVTETLNEFRRMGLVKFIPSKGRGNKRFIELIHAGK